MFLPIVCWWALLYGRQNHCTGLYGMRKKHLERMDIVSRGFSIEPEIAIKASRMKLKMHDIPIEYQPRRGKAKLCSFKAGWGHLKTILRASLPMAGFPNELDITHFRQNARFVLDIPRRHAVSQRKCLQVCLQISCLTARRWISRQGQPESCRVGTILPPCPIRMAARTATL